MAKENSIMLMGTNIMGLGVGMKGMALVLWNLQMVIALKVTGVTIKRKVKVYILIQMVTNFKVTGFLTIKKDLENW